MEPNDALHGTPETRIKRRDIFKSAGVTAGSVLFPGIAAACSSSSSDSGGGLSGTHITVATVSNPQIDYIQKLVKHFEDDTGIKVKFTSLNEIDLRKKIKQDVSLDAGKFDVVMVGQYEVPIYAKNNWITSLESYFSKMSKKNKKDYDLGDVLPVWRTALSHNGKQYALPIYGESSFLLYRKDLLKRAGLKMPDQPTWGDITKFAKRLNSGKVNGIVLRGEPGWGSNMGLFTTMINTFGGRWYDEDWKPQLTSSEVKAATDKYSMLINKYGQSGASSDSFPECENLFTSGKGALWYDATSAASYVANPKKSKVADKVGFAPAPKGVTDHGKAWLWTWSLAIEAASKEKEAAFEFIKWATSKEVVDLIGKKYGWANTLGGTRASTYKSTKYGKQPWADLELDAIKAADFKHPTKQSVPYEGIQYLNIPEWSSLGDNVGRYLAQTISGKSSVSKFQDDAQKEALKVSKQGKYFKG